MLEDTVARKAGLRIMSLSTVAYNAFNAQLLCRPADAVTIKRLAKTVSDAHLPYRRRRKIWP